MRNLIEYPITYAEKIATLRQVINDYMKEEVAELTAGDMTVCVLNAILNDLYRATASDEGILG